MFNTIKNKSNPLRRSGVAAGLLIPAFLVSLLWLLAAQGAFESLDRAMMDMRFRVIDREPSDTLVVVEIDPLSLKHEARWPWPRDRYATAIENLQDAGAALIAFDVDFSSLSDSAGDVAFVHALDRRPGEVVLPVFWQSSARSGENAEIVKTAPHEAFLQYAVIASVTMKTEKSGVVRRGWHGFDDNGTYRASIAGTLADSPGARSGSFYIDYGIGTSKIRRLSFRDVMNGDFDRDIVSGKKILIGATALELGDEFATPIEGVIPGVYLHALSYESLLLERALVRPHYAIPLLLAALVVFLLCRRASRQRWRAAVIAHAVVFLAAVGAPVVIQMVSPVSFDTGVILVAQGLCLVFAISAELRRRMQQIIRHRLATARYQALMSLIVRDNADGVVVANAQGVVELFNDRANALLGFPEGALDQSLITDLAPDFPVYPAAPAETPSAPENNGPISTEYAVPGRDDLVLEVVANCVTYEDPSEQGAAHLSAERIFVYSLRDISARKRTEAAERDAKDAAIAANKLKTQLISNMSHELRTPLNGVIGFAGILRDESFGALGAPEYKEYADTIHTSGKRLLGLVNDMLSIARLDANDFNIETDLQSLADIVEDCLREFETQVADEEKTVEVQIPKDLPSVKIDFRVFKELLSHLISNAVKFTDKGGVITISARSEKSDLILDVTDDGCGIDPSALPKLTDAFYQADADLSRTHEGAGLGLHIVSKFAALHNGDVTFESNPGEGFAARLQFKKMVSEPRSKAA